MELKIQVDRAKCMGSGQCVHWAPGVFSQDAEGISVVVDAAGESEETIVTATTSCPVEAIGLEIDEAPIAPRDLAHWTRGAFLDDGLVPLLDALAEDHDELRTQLRRLTGRGVANTDSGGGTLSDDVVNRLINSYLAHQEREEDEAFPVIGALVGSSLVEAFRRSHTQIRRVVDWLRTEGSDRVPHRASSVQFAAMLDRHIRLEEVVLFRVALGKLASGLS